jgi:hypothetical protein
MGKLTAGQQAGTYYARKRNRSTSLVTDVVSRAQGNVSFSANSAQTVTIGGTVVTFGTSFALGADLTATLAALLAYLVASSDTNLLKATYQVIGSALVVRCKVPGAGHLTLAASAGAVSNGSFTLPQIRKRAAL